MSKPRPIWTHQIQVQFDGAFLAVVESVVVFQFFDKHLDTRIQALSDFGEPLWSLDWERCQNFFIYDDKVYLGGLPARCVDPQTGALLADSNLGGHAAVRLPIPSGPVYATAESILGVNPHTLQILWQHPDPTEEFSAIDAYLVRYRESGELTLVPLATMEPRTLQVEPRATVAGWLNVRAGLLCEFPLTEGGRRAFDLETGDLVWKFEDPPGYYLPIFDENACYAGADGVSCFDLRSGKRVWNQRFGKSTVGLTSVPSLADGKLYLSTNDGVVRVLNAATGEVPMSYPAGEEVFAVRRLDANRIVYATRRKIVCLEWA